MSIKLKLVITFIFLSLIPMLFTSSILYSRAKTNITSEVLNKLELIGQLKETQINREINNSLQELEGIINSVQLQSFLSEYYATDSQDDLELVKIMLNDIKDHRKDFFEITIYSPDGMIVTTVNNGTSTIDQTPLKVIQSGSKQNTFFLNTKDNLSVTFLAGPILLKDQNIGTLIITTLSENILKIMDTEEELDGTFDLVLASRNDEGNAVFIAGRKFEDHANARLIIPKNETWVCTSRHQTNEIA